MPYYLGIDGGGTKTICAVGDESSLLATGIAGPSNIVRVGEAKTSASLQQAVEQACATAGITPARISRTCVGGSGAAHPELAAIVRAFLAEIIPTPIDVVGDMEIAMEAAFGEGPGVIVIAGTGSIAFGRNQEGATARAGGWGFAIGDEGSAHWIGRAAVNALLRSLDRRGDDRHGGSTAQIPLAFALFKAWGVNSATDLARAANSTPPPDFAALFPAVVSSSDAVASQVLTAAGRELADLAAVIIERLFSSADTVPVAITGGVFRHSEVVRDIFYNELRRISPRAQINLQVVEPVEGALRMARKAAGKQPGR